MLHPPLIVLGYAEAAALLRQLHGEDIGAVISIHGQREFAVETQAEHHLVLQFDDVEAPDPDDHMAAYRSRLRQRQAAEYGLTLTPPTVQDAQRLIDFAGTIAGIEMLVLCQCQGGISRSPAAALILLATWTGQGNEDHCAEYLLRLRPAAVPHRDLVAFGDRLLGRAGRLIRALSDHQRD